MSMERRPGLSYETGEGVSGNKYQMIKSMANLFSMLVYSDLPVKSLLS
jgi:hypothetical protein